MNDGNGKITSGVTEKLGNVLSTIHESCGLQHGRLEDLNGVAVVTDEEFTANAEFNFVGGMAPGK